MAADDQIQASYRLMREMVGGSTSILVDQLDYTQLDETSPSTQIFVNGGAPVGGGIRVYSSREFVWPGEYLVIQGKPVATKTLDSTGATSHKLLIGIRITDLVTGQKSTRFLRASDRNTSRVPDDGSKVLDIWNDFWAFLVPNGMKYQLFGLLQIDARTTA